MHFVRKHILRVLCMQKWARFRDMRPSNVDSNLYNYHLKQLVKDGYVEQNKEKGYRLSPLGLRFVDHVSIESFEPRWQPKVITMFVASSEGKYLVFNKYKQPFINKWTFLNGKVHYEDDSLIAAAKREISYVSDILPKDLRKAGVIEYIANINNDTVSHSIAHVFTGTLKAQDINSERANWLAPEELEGTKSAPATIEIIHAFERGDSQFDEFVKIDW